MVDLFVDRDGWNVNKLVLIAVVIFFLVLPLFSSDATIMLVAEIVCFSLFAMSVNLLLGYTGMIAFGHAGLYGIGVYSCAMLMKKAGFPFALALTISPIMSAGAGVIIGFFCTRLAGLKFALLSLAFGQIVWAIIFKWYSFTGGDDGIIDIPFPSFLESLTSTYYFIFIVVAVATFALWKIVNSPFGWTLQSIRENTQRVYFIGTNARFYQVTAFVISSFFAGLSGALFVIISHNAFPEYAFWSKGGEAIIMVVLGGMFSFFGPIIGAFVLLFLHTFILSLTQYWPFFLGVILLAIMLLAPQGIAGLIGERAAVLRRWGQVQ